MGQVHSALNSRFIQTLTADDEVHVDAGEHFGVDRTAFRGEFDLAAADLKPAALEDQNHVVSGATASARQNSFHWPRCEVTTAAVGGTVHGDEVAASGFGHEGHASVREPIDGAVHGDRSSWSGEWAQNLLVGSTVASCFALCTKLRRDLRGG
jgi:hypothetical protein